MFQTLWESIFLFIYDSTLCRIILNAETQVTINFCTPLQLTTSMNIAPRSIDKIENRV